MAVSLSTSARWNEFGDEVVALNIETGRYFSLNKTGILLWRALANVQEESALYSLLVTEYALDEETSRKHVEAFLRKLDDFGLLQREVLDQRER